VENRLREALVAQALASSGVSIEPGRFPTVEKNLPDLTVAISAFREEREALRAALGSYLAAANTRLTTALSILRDPLAKVPLPDRNAQQQEIEELSHAFGNISAAMPYLRELQDESCVLAARLEARDQTHSELADAGLVGSLEICRGRLARIREILGSTGYPFPHPKGRISLGEYMEAKEYNPDPARMLQLEVQSHLSRGKVVYTRILARLCAVAEQLEQVIPL
jgi:hypothetical protein